MARVLLWHPDKPHTRDNPLERDERRLPRYLDQGWQEWPPPEPFPPSWWEDHEPVQHTPLNEGEEE